MHLGNLLKHYIEEQHEENVRLKSRVVELEATLNPKPLFTTPITINAPKENTNTYVEYL